MSRRGGNAGVNTSAHGAHHIFVLLTSANAAKCWFVGEIKNRLFPMTDPYVNGRLMLARLVFFVDGKCDTINMAYDYIRIRHGFGYPKMMNHWDSSRESHWSSDPNGSLDWFCWGKTGNRFLPWNISYRGSGFDAPINQRRGWVTTKFTNL